MFPPQEDMFPPKIIWQNNGKLLITQYDVIVGVKS